MRQRGRRWRRSLLAATGVAAILVLCGCDADGGNGDAPLAEVRVGDCFGTDEVHSIPCSEQHLAQTIFVSDAPPGRGTAALKPCREAQAGFLGQDFNSRLDVRLWVSADGSWYRCDLVLRSSTQAGSGYAQVIGSLEDGFRRSVPLYLQACLDAPYDPLLDQEYVSCAEPHRSRELTVAPAIGTLDEPFPPGVVDRAVNACNATAAGSHVLGEGRIVEAYYPENPEAWDSGERTADCWVTATRGLLPAVTPRG
jgi:Septum formation